MDTERKKVVAWGEIFTRLFDPSPAQVALLDLQGLIIATNRAWKRFGAENGLPPNYSCVGRNYLEACETAAAAENQSAKQAYIGLLEVINTRRPKFTMVYPCHHPAERRQWYRMWVEPQMPQVPAVIVAHHFYRDKPLTDEGGYPKFTPGQLPDMYSAFGQVSLAQL